MAPVIDIVRNSTCSANLPVGSVLKPLRILQLSDLHLFADSKTKLLNINTFDTSKAVIAQMQLDISLQPADLLLLTGDLSQDYSSDSYCRVMALLSEFTCPIGICLGNHDNQQIFGEIFGASRPRVQEFVFNHWAIILLNSNKPGAVSGYLQKQDLELLRELLAQHEKSGKSVLIFLHHHVLPVGSVWLDNLKLENADELLPILDAYRNIKAVVCGHVHQATWQRRNNTDFISTPSTSWQWTPGSANFTLDSLMPGYRWFELHPDGQYATDVVRVEHNDALLPDFLSAGY